MDVRESSGRAILDQWGFKMSWHPWQRTTKMAFSVIIVATVLGMSGPAVAASIGISVGAPESVVVGQDVEVKAVLSDDGTPVEGAEIALTYKTTFAGKSARVELARATTDKTGTAVMVYQQRSDSNTEMQIVYLGPETAPVEPFMFTITVEAEGVQLYSSESGVEIPFINGTLVIVVITGVWSLIALSAVYLVRVGKAGQLVDEPAQESGSMWISVLLASAAIFTAIGMVIVFIRAPVSNTDLTDPETFDRTEIGYLGEIIPYVGFGLGDTSAAQTGDPVEDGRVLSFQYGCAACHAPSGLGAVVGPALVGEIGSFSRFVEDIREGPKGMPVYRESVLSEEDLHKIYDFLSQGR